MLVTTPSALSRGVVQRSVAALKRTPNPALGYIENMSGYYCADCGSVKPLFAESDPVDFGMPCLGKIPFDPQLSGEATETRADAVFGEIADTLEADPKSAEESR